MAKYTTDLTQLGHDGRLRENLNFEAETTRLMKMLGKDSGRQPVLLNDDKANQETIVEQLALRIAKGNVPTDLLNKKVIKLETAFLFSTAKTPADATAALDAVLRGVIASRGQTIIYVDELSNLIASDEAKADLIKGVASGNLKIVGASGIDAYRQQIETKPEIATLFDGILVEDSASETVKKPVNYNEGYRGDNISSDLRAMIASYPGSKRVDVIIQAKDANNAALRQLMADGRAIVTGHIRDTLIVNLPLSVLQNLSSSGLINYISPDRPTRTTGFVETTTGLSLMRQQAASGGRPAYTLDGSGMAIAVLDSGIYAAHNGFKNNNGASRIVANVNFTTESGTNDGYGHGTHVAGLAAGNQAYNGGAYKGVANAANIVSVKVLASNGAGQTSWLLNGLDWVLQNKTQYNIRVVNLSLGGDAVDSYTNDPVCLKVRDLVNAGIVVVAAAGNEGKTESGQKVYGMIHSPGNSPYVITVGATNTLDTVSHADDTIATYSSRGPTRSFFTTSNGVMSSTT